MSGPAPSGDGPGRVDAADERVTVTPMRRRHLRAVLRIEDQQPHEGWSFGLFLSELARGDDRTYLVARQGGRVVGYLGLLYVLEDGHVTTLAVDASCRRRHIATRLLAVGVREALEHGAENLTLEVRASNEAALALYRSFGFAPVGVRAGYYSDVGEDAIIMWATGIDSPEHRRRVAALEAGLPVPTVLDGIGS